MVLWLGNKVAGQVFCASKGGTLRSIAILPEFVPKSGGQLKMILCHFNPETKKWLEKIEQAEVKIDAAMVDSWVSFSFNNVQLNPGSWYGFKLVFTGGMIAVAEGARRGNGKYSLEWGAVSTDEPGYYHTDFHLAYRVALAA